MRGRAITKLTYPSAQSAQAFWHHVRRQDDGSVNPILGLTNMQTFMTGIKCHIANHGVVGRVGFHVRNEPFLTSLFEQLKTPRRFRIAA
jgi:hypothetical protein